MPTIFTGITTGNRLDYLFNVTGEAPVTAPEHAPVAPATLRVELTRDPDEADAYEVDCVAVNAVGVNDPIRFFYHGHPHKQREIPSWVTAAVARALAHANHVV